MLLEVAYVYETFTDQTEEKMTLQTDKSVSQDTQVRHNLKLDLLSNK